MINLPYAADCEFCDEFAGGRANSFAAHYGNDIASRTILERGTFRILPSLGQIVPGYLLLVPNRHYRAFADMSWGELKAADDLKDQMRTFCGSSLLFEHGARTSDSGGCGISHAHLHLVPFPEEKDPVEELTRSFPFEELTGLLDLKRVQPGRSYLYYESVRGNKYVLYPPFIPSQYVRRLLASALGSEAWDWRRCGREEELLRTVAHASRMLSAAR